MGESLRALFVEDSEADMVLVARQLRKAGYDLITQRVESENDFRKALDETTWDIILSDYSMPHLNGSVALRILKEKNLDIPFIVVSGTLGEEAAVDLMKSGANDFFLKGRTTRLPSAIEREIREAKHRQQQRAAESSLLVRARQQAAVAELGQRALKNMRLDSLINEAVQVVAVTLDVECARILELLEDGETLIIRVDTEGQNGQVRVSEDSHVAYVLASTQPVIVEDVATETRFAVSPSFLECTSGMSVIIEGREKPFGIIDAFNVNRRAFTKDDIHFLQSIANILANAIMNAQLFESEIRAREAAELANELKTRFLGMISHELRTPLTSIKGFLSTLLATDVEWDEASRREFLTIADNEADNLTELIEQLLDMTRISAGTFAVAAEPVSISAVINSAISRLAQTANIIVAVPENLPRVRADSKRIQQVLINLLDNAMRFSPEGKPVRVSAYLADDIVQVDVQDEGPGIPAEARETVFEAFRQYQRRVENRGTGLGLAISRGIIKAHGGNIWIQVRDVPGTTVSFTLPLV